MHLCADQPTLRDHTVEHGVPNLVVLRALNERCERMEPAWVYDLIPSLQLNDDAVVERSSAKNLPGIGATTSPPVKPAMLGKAVTHFVNVTSTRGAAPFEFCVWIAAAAVDGPVGARDGWPSQAAASRHKLKIMRYRITSSF
jgi:hypothetical protein